MKYLKKYYLLPITVFFLVSAAYLAYSLLTLAKNASRNNPNFTGGEVPKKVDHWDNKQKQRQKEKEQNKKFPYKKL